MKQLTQRSLKLTQIALAVFMGVGAYSSALAQNVLPSDVRINGKQVWKAFESQRQVLQTSSAVIYTDEKSHVKSVYGVVVSSDGHVLTKASEIEGRSHLSMRIDRELFTDVEVIGMDPKWDVAMLKVHADHTFVPGVEKHTAGAIGHCQCDYP